MLLFFVAFASIVINSVSLFKKPERVNSGLQSC